MQKNATLVDIIRQSQHLLCPSPIPHTTKGAHTHGRPHGSIQPEQTRTLHTTPISWSQCPGGYPVRLPPNLGVCQPGTHQGCPYRGFSSAPTMNTYACAGS